MRSFSSQENIKQETLFFALLMSSKRYSRDIKDFLYDFSFPWGISNANMVFCSRTLYLKQPRLCLIACLQDNIVSHYIFLTLFFVVISLPLLLTFEILSSALIACCRNRLFQLSGLCFIQLCVLSAGQSFPCGAP